MRSLSLAAKLSGAFTLITLLTFYLVGNQLYNSLSRQLLGNLSERVVVKAQRLRSLVAEEESSAALRSRVSHFQGLLAANDVFVVQIRSGDGRVLIDFNPSALPVAAGSVIPDGQPARDSDLREWPSASGSLVRGIAVQAHLHNGEAVTIIVGRSLDDVLHPLDQFRKKLVRAIILGALLAMALSYLLVSGTLRPLHRITRQASRITMERLSTRLELSDASPELQALSASLNGMLARLERRFQLLSTYTENLAHDLRTPLNNLRGQTEVTLSRARSAEEYQTLLASNLEEYERLGRMIENILFLARAENPQLALKPAMLDLSEQLQLVAEYFEGLAHDGGATLQVHASGTVMADAQLLRRAVSNLLSNSLRYTPPGGVIELASARRDGGVVVSVTNPGPGIAPEHLDKIFERFYRVDQARSNSSESTGLGLAIVRSIMDLHYGHCSAESAGGVTRISLYFPDIATGAPMAASE